MTFQAKALFIAAALLVAATPAFACKGKTTMFSDDFREVDDSWGSDPAYVSVEDGRVKVKTDANTGYGILYSSTAFDKFDFCLTVRMPNNVEPTVSDGDGGLIFWASDNSNYYAFLISPNGAATVQRKNKGKWTVVVTSKKIEGVKTGPGAKNRLRVTADGGNLTFAINDLRFASIKGQAPPEPGQIGLRADSEATKRDAWKFFDLVVTDLAK